MPLLPEMTFDAMALSLVTCVMLREAMIVALPDRIAGPGGWLVDTRPRRRR